MRSVVLLVFRNALVDCTHELVSVANQLLSHTSVSRGLMVCILMQLMGGSNVDTLFGVSTTPTERSPEGARPSRDTYSDLL